MGRAIFRNLLELAKATVLALGAWRVAMLMLFPLPPVADGTLTVAASLMGTRLSVRPGARWSPRPVGYPPSVASAAMLVIAPLSLGDVTKAEVGVTITLVQLCCRLLPVAAMIGR